MEITGNDDFENLNLQTLTEKYLKEIEWCSKSGF